MPEPRIIKKYANRKLYDTTRSSYITLDGIATLIQEGEDILILDRQSGDDITSQILAQILLVHEKKKKNIVPIATIKGLIKSSGEIFQRRLATPVASLKDDAERKLAALLGRGEVGAFVKELSASSQKNLDEFSRHWEERLGRMLNRQNGSDLSKEVRALEKRIEKLEAKLRK